MLITKAELERFSGVYHDSGDGDLSSIYIGTAEEMINNYVGYDVEEEFLEQREVENEDGETETVSVLNAPQTFKQVCLEIATLLQMEEAENIGVNSKSFSETGTRSFLNVTDFSRYLAKLSAWRKNAGNV